jgi:hypothetical protein
MTDQNLILLGTGRHPRTLEARRRNNHPRRTFWVGELFIQSKSRHSVTVAWARKNFEAIIKAIDTGCLQVTYGTDDFVDPAELRALCFPEKAASNEPWPWVSSFIARVGLATYNHIVRIQVAVGDSGMDFDKPDGLRSPKRGAAWEGPLCGGLFRGRPYGTHGNPQGRRHCLHENARGME